MRLTFLLILQFVALCICGQDLLSIESPNIGERIFDSSFFPELKGKLTNIKSAKDEKIVIKYTSLVPGLKGQRTKLVTLKEDYTFSIKLDCGLPYQQLWLSIGDLHSCQVMLHQGAEIEIDLQQLRLRESASDISSITYGGPDSSLNAFISNFDLFKPRKKEALQKKKINILSNSSLKIKDKVSQLVKLEDDYIGLQDNFIKKNGDEFKWILENERKSTLFADILSLYLRREMPRETLDLCTDHVPLILSNAANRYYDYLSFNMKLLTSHEEKMIEGKVRKIKAEPGEDQAAINRFLDQVDRKRIGIDYDVDLYESGIDWYERRYDSLYQDHVYQLERDKIANLSKEKAALVMLKGQPFELEARAVYHEIMLPNIEVNWCADLMKRELEVDIKREEEINNLFKEEGRPDTFPELGQLVSRLPSGALYTSTSESPEQLLKTIKGYYEGSAVIINLWSIWCSPCLVDMRSSKYIEQKLSNLPVEVIHLHICDHSTVSQWRGQVSEAMMGGDHIYLDSKLSVQLIEYLDLQGFPNYMLVDLDGNYDPNCISSLSKLEGKDLRSMLGGQDELSDNE